MVESGQITIRELLRDPQFKAYFVKVPKLPDHYTPDAEPWRLLVVKQGETRWRSKRFGTYQEAFAGFKKMLPSITDAAINCPGLSFMPPTRTVKLKGKFEVVKGIQKPILRTLVWAPRLEADMAKHHWCGYCRRPTVFVNKGMPPRMLNGFTLPATRVAYRCNMCGATDELMDIRNPENNQQWDTSRPRFYRA
jgi:hypothetical protein